MFRTFPFTAFEVPEVRPGSGEPVPAPVAAPPVAAPVAEPQPGPWSADLAQYIEDPAARAAADRYLREKVQPRMTQFEQDAAHYEGAHRLYDDLLEDADATMVSIAEQVYGEDVAKSIADALQAQQQEAQTVTEPTQPQLSPEQEAAVAWAEEQRQQSEWTKAVSPYKTEGHALYDADFDEQDFAPFVVTSEGDLGKAYDGYSAWRERATAKYRPAEPTPAAPTPPAPVLGTGSADAAAPTPGVQKRYDSIDSALDDWLNEQRAAPPAVGSV